MLVSFDPTDYSVTEGDDEFVELFVVRSGDIARETVVVISALDGLSATGIYYTATVTSDIH